MQKCLNIPGDLEVQSVRLNMHNKPTDATGSELKRAPGVIQT